MEIYLVGGAVRDQLLGLPVKDRDWVVIGETPDALMRLGYQQVGKSFPVFLHPKSKEEYALARTERKVGSGHSQFNCYYAPDVTLEQDLSRRDLTINAIAQSTDGQLIDPYQGLLDIKNRRLRHVSKAYQEDPLRVLRTARFAARFSHLGFTVADETLTLMTDMSHSGELSTLSAERVWSEIQRALTEQKPEIFFQVLRQCGALKMLLPELDCLFGIPNPVKWHPEIDTGVHTLMTLQQAVLLGGDIEVRFAALVHDLGKGTSPKAHWPGHHGHEERGVALIEKLCERLKVPNQMRRLAVIVSRFHTHCHQALTMKATTLIKVLEKLDAFRRPLGFQQFLLVCEADARGRKGLEQKAYPQADYFKQIWLSAKAVNSNHFQQQGLQGKSLGEAIAKGQIAAAKALKAQYLSN